MRRLYQSGVAAGWLRPDARQEAAVDALSKLQERIVRYEPQIIEYRRERDAIARQVKFQRQQQQRQQQQESLCQQRLGALPREEEAKKTPIEVYEDPFTVLGPLPRKPRGLFLHGEVGTGKTCLMDMFYESLDVKHKRRVHLHEFMLEVHERIHRWKHSERDRLIAVAESLPPEQLDDPTSRFLSPGSDLGKDKPRIKMAESDGITEVGKMIADESTVLALDEFVVSDVVDALILKHLFGVMFERGTVLVTTSNTAPEDLYKDGLNYFYFQPFIPLLTAHCKVFNMMTQTDYRQLRRRSAKAENDDYQLQRYLSPVTVETQALFDETFQLLSGGDTEAARSMQIAFGRSLVVERAVGNKVCRFTFNELCGDFEPIMAAPDYQALCNNFQTVMVEGVPSLDLANHNELRRFIIFIDELYDRNVELVILADRPLDDLYDGETQLKKKDETVLDGLFALTEMKTAKKRMLSRLVEMTC